MPSEFSPTNGLAYYKDKDPEWREKIDVIEANEELNAFVDRCVRELPETLLRVAKDKTDFYDSDPEFILKEAQRRNGQSTTPNS